MAWVQSRWTAGARPQDANARPLLTMARQKDPEKFRSQVPESARAPFLALAAAIDLTRCYLAVSPVYLGFRVMHSHRLFQSAPVLLALMAGTALLPRPGFALTMDYSNQPLTPSLLSFAPGSDDLSIENEFCNDGNGFTCTLIDDKDYVTFRVPDGRSMISLVLESYEAPNDISFIAIQAGNQFTAIPKFSDRTLPGSIAFSHFGLQGLLIDQSLLSSPLSAGDYSLWIQQSSPGTTRYRFSANLNPAPGPLPVLGVAAALGWSRRLRRRCLRLPGAQGREGCVCIDSVLRGTFAALRDFMMSFVLGVPALMKTTRWPK